ncbi:nitroreductase family protein [Candidatus Peregrinibacteria bacterium]|nr:nitroreductase family protein [Candidatus Peregrinibacteria bacterium]MBI3816754.1 nitroreductase family protein [Candidatus Peregrinibacteria bacterium]
MDYPRKPVQTTLPILEAIRERWSPLSFSDQPIEQEKIMTLFEAARWAPSSFNEQPWRYIYATKDDKDDRKSLESLLVEGNSWAKSAYLLLISFAVPVFARNGKENRHAMHDLGAASGFLALQLPSLRLIGHQMAGFDFARANEVLGVPPEFIPGSMMAIGYPGDSALLDSKLKDRENAARTRRPVNEFASRGRWWY